MLHRICSRFSCYVIQSVQQQSMTSAEPWLRLKRPVQPLHVFNTSPGGILTTPAHHTVILSAFFLPSQSPASLLCLRPIIPNRIDIYALKPVDAATCSGCMVIDRAIVFITCWSNAISFAIRRNSKCIERSCTLQQCTIPDKQSVGQLKTYSGQLSSSQLIAM